MGPFDDFKFKIGDIVQFVEQPVEPYANMGKNKKVVIERIIQECHGGIQRHYRLRGGDRLIDITEMEIEPYQKPEPRK